MLWEIALPLTAAGSGAAWAHLAAARAGSERRAVFAIRALLGGAAAFGLALTAYDLLGMAGVHVHWHGMTSGDAEAVFLAGAVGLVEEGAKLVGLLLVVERGFRTSAILASAIGVAAGFSGLEALLVLHGEASAAALARAALGPVAHGLLMVPLAFGVGAALRRTRLPWLPVPISLAVAATLHGMADLSLATPWLGAAGYAAALVAPAAVLYARVRRASSRAQVSRAA